MEPGSTHDLLVVHPAPPMPSQVGRTDRPRLLRTRIGYGWDYLDVLRLNGWNATERVLTP